MKMKSKPLDMQTAKLRQKEHDIKNAKRIAAEKCYSFCSIKLRTSFDFLSEYVWVSWQKVKMFLFRTYEYINENI
jgi:hypothetical protein